MVNFKSHSRLTFVFLSVMLLLVAGSANAAFVWEDSFVNGVVPTTEQDDGWTAFKAQLVPEGTYYSMRISGSLDTVGLTCTDATASAEFANLLNTNTSGIVECDGHQWSLCANRYNGEVWIDPPGLCDGNNCPSPGMIIRPGIFNENWGGVGTATCSAPSQTMRFEFNADVAPLESIPVPTLSWWGLMLLVLLIGAGFYTWSRKTA